MIQHKFDNLLYLYFHTFPFLKFSFIPIIIIRRAADVPFLPCRLSLLKSLFKFSYPLLFVWKSKHFYPWIMLRSKYFSFKQILSTSLCIIFCTHTMLQSSSCYNAQHIVHFHKILVRITAFGFTHIFCLRVALVLCTLPHVQRSSWFLHIFCTTYLILLVYNFRNCAVLISKLHWWFFSCFSPAFYRFFK